MTLHFIIDVPSVEDGEFLINILKNNTFNDNFITYCSKVDFVEGSYDQVSATIVTTAFSEGNLFLKMKNYLKRNKVNYDFIQIDYQNEDNEFENSDYPPTSTETNDVFH